MSEGIVGIDLGGTNIKAGLVSPDGQVLQAHHVPTEAEAGPAAVARRICRATRECLEQAGVAPEAARGIGVGSPGTIDLDAGVVTFSPNLPGWHDIPLREMIEGDLGLDCVLDNDANVAALAEQWIGAGEGASSVVLLTLGTGIGGGIVLDGRIWHGGKGVAGEIGHMCINPEGPRCGCGNCGCLEAYASATAMVRRLREAVAEGAETPLAEHLEELTARAIHEAAVGGDPIARRNIEMTGRYLGVGVSNIMHILNPEVVLFSGGVTAAGQMLLDPVLEEVEWRTMDDSRRDVRVAFAELPDTAGIIGAARCFMLA
ncbi:MAG: ROK family protein [Candidatus Brocadiaceae bacterium]|jgi:glucokinase